jgi:hypothetical protein
VLDDLAAARDRLRAAVLAFTETVGEDLAAVGPDHSAGDRVARALVDGLLVARHFAVADALSESEAATLLDAFDRAELKRGLTAFHPDPVLEAGEREALLSFAAQRSFPSPTGPAAAAELLGAAGGNAEPADPPLLYGPLRAAGAGERYRDVAVALAEAVIALDLRRTPDERLAMQGLRRLLGAGGLAGRLGKRLARFRDLLAGPGT